MTAPLWDPWELASAVGAIAAPVDARSVTGVAFDSREVQPGDLFVALKGASQDGHRFAPQAFERGAAAALVSLPVEGGPFFVVGDTQAALEALGRAARARLGREARVIAVTGSVGKTSVKEAIRACLAEQGPTHASVRSYNNQTGVPLSLARMPADTRYGVFEIGMNHRGEIAPLAAQVAPHIALVTHVGTAHIENLGSQEAIADEKADIFSAIVRGGAALIPIDSPWRDRLEARARAFTDGIVTFGLAEGARVRGRDLLEDAGGSQFTADVAGTVVRVTLPRPGRHHVLNALATLAACYCARGPDHVAETARALATLDAPPGRGRVLATPGGARVIDESYNANPDSMAAALATLAAMPARGRKLAVLGAMRELGPFSAAAHASLAPLVSAAGVAHAIIVDEEARPLADALPGAGFAPDWRAALDLIRPQLRAGDLLLIKGSNSIGLSHVVAALAAPEA